MRVGSADTPARLGSDDIAAVYAIRDDAGRNRLITQSYCELSRAMKALIGPHASWCTFSTWSSRTIGYFIRGDIDPLLEYRLTRLPRWLRNVVRAPLLFLNRRLSRARKRAAPRLLARGNREIFAEIANEFARFIDEFAAVPEADPQRWRRYRDTIRPAPASDLFPAADIELMRAGFEAYHDAKYEPEMRRQAELVLRGNILLADYEQQRVDPIVRSALSLFPSRLLQDDPSDPALLTVREKKPWALQDTGRIRTWIDRVYSWLVTKWRMAIVLPRGAPLRLHSELIRVGYGLPKPPRGDSLYASRLHTLRDPELVELWSRHDRSHGSYRAARARNWTNLDDRMNCIVNVFRSRQDKGALYEIDPLTPEELQAAFPLASE